MDMLVKLYSYVTMPHMEANTALCSQCRDYTHSIRKYSCTSHLVYVSLLIIYQVLLTGYGPETLSRFLSSLFFCLSSLLPSPFAFSLLVAFTQVVMADRGLGHAAAAAAAPDAVEVIVHDPAAAPELAAADDLVQFSEAVDEDIEAEARALFEAENIAAAAASEAATAAARVARATLVARSLAALRARARLPPSASPLLRPPGAAARPLLPALFAISAVQHAHEDEDWEGTSVLSGAGSVAEVATVSPVEQVAASGFKLSDFKTTLGLRVTTTVDTFRFLMDRLALALEGQHINGRLFAADGSPFGLCLVESRSYGKASDAVIRADFRANPPARVHPSVEMKIYCAVRDLLADQFMACGSHLDSSDGIIPLLAALHVAHLTVSEQTYRETLQEYHDVRMTPAVPGRDTIATMSATLVILRKRLMGMRPTRDVEPLGQQLAESVSLIPEYSVVTEMWEHERPRFSYEHAVVLEKLLAKELKVNKRAAPSLAPGALLATPDKVAGRDQQGRGRGGRAGSSHSGSTATGGLAPAGPTVPGGPAEAGAARSPPVCWQCGKSGHRYEQCRSAPSEAGRQARELFRQGRDRRGTAKAHIAGAPGAPDAAAAVPALGPTQSEEYAQFQNAQFQNWQSQRLPWHASQAFHAPSPPTPPPGYTMPSAAAGPPGFTMYPSPLQQGSPMGYSATAGFMMPLYPSPQQHGSPMGYSASAPDSRGTMHGPTGAPRANVGRVLVDGSFLCSGVPPVIVPSTRRFTPNLVAPSMADGLFAHVAVVAPLVVSVGAVVADPQVGLVGAGPVVPVVCSVGAVVADPQVSLVGAGPVVPVVCSVGAAPTAPVICSVESTEVQQDVGSYSVVEHGESLRVQVTHSSPGIRGIPLKYVSDQSSSFSFSSLACAGFRLLSVQFLWLLVPIVVAFWHAFCLDLAVEALIFIANDLLSAFITIPPVAWVAISLLLQFFHQSWKPAWSSLRSVCTRAVHGTRQWCSAVWFLVRVHPRLLLRCAGISLCVSLLSSPAFWSMGPSPAFDMGAYLAPSTCSLADAPSPLSPVSLTAWVAHPNNHEFRPFVVLDFQFPAALVVRRFNGSTDDPSSAGSACAATLPATPPMILDSGASLNLFRERSQFSTLESVTNMFVLVADGSRIPIVGVGTVTFDALDKNSRTHRLVLKEVFLVPALSANLLSTNRTAALQRWYFTVGPNGMSVRAGSHCTLQVPFSVADHLAYLQPLRYVGSGGVDPPACACASSTVSSGANIAVAAPDRVQLLHRQLGHVNFHDLSKLHEVADGIPMISGSDYTCEQCLRSKAQKARHPSIVGPRSTAIHELLHADVCGPFRVPSGNHYRYYLIVIDDFSRFSWIFGLSAKSDVAAVLSEHITFLTLHSPQHPVLALRTDNGGEFISTIFQTFLKSTGIRFEPTVPYNPQSNGVAERANRTIISRARCLLGDSGLSAFFWFFAVSHVVWLLNRLPCSSRQGRTPFELYSRARPVLSDLHVWGSRAVHYMAPAHKFVDPGRPCRWLGYHSTDGSAYVLDDTSHTVNRAHETCLHFLPTDPLCRPHTAVTPGSPPPPAGASSSTPPVGAVPSMSPAVPRRSPRLHPVGASVLCALFLTISSLLPFTAARESVSSDAPVSFAFPVVDVARVSSVAYQACFDPLNLATATALNLDNAAPVCFLVPSLDVVPADYWSACRDAVYGAEWENASAVELDGLTGQETWEIVPKPEGVSVMGCKYVYRIKTGPHGEIVKFKARLVCLGCNQKPGRDFDPNQISAPVVGITSLRTMLAVMVNLPNVTFAHWDVTGAFLYGAVEEDLSLMATC